MSWRMCWISGIVGIVWMAACQPVVPQQEISTPGAGGTPSRVATIDATAADPSTEAPVAATPSSPGATTSPDQAEMEERVRQDLAGELGVPVETVIVHEASQEIWPDRGPA